MHSGMFDNIDGVVLMKAAKILRDVVDVVEDCVCGQVVSKSFAKMAR